MSIEDVDFGTMPRVREPHEFAPFPGGRWPTSCLKCGLHKDNPVHITNKETNDGAE